MKMRMLITRGGMTDVEEDNGDDEDEDGQEMIVQWQEALHWLKPAPLVRARSIMLKPS